MRTPSAEVLPDSRSIRMLYFLPYDNSHKRVQYVGRGAQSCEFEHLLEGGDVCGRITSWTIPHELEKIAVLLGIVAEHQIAEDKPSPYGEEVREPLNRTPLGWVGKVMEGVVRVDFIDPGRADGVR